MIKFEQLTEGVYDPNIFKAIFLAGGPGSGKSYVAGKTIRGEGLKVVNSDDAFEKLLKKAGLSLQMPDKEADLRDPVRARAKQITSKRQANYIDGRLGLIIDGTAREYDKIARQSNDLKQLGYDTYMVFVNTSLDVALERNAKRPRRVPEPIVARSWKAVQSNIGKFSLHFRQGFIVVDNNDAKEDVFGQVYKQVMSLAKSKVQNPMGQKWIANAIAMKRRM